MATEFRTVVVRSPTDTWHKASQNLDDGTLLSMGNCSALDTSERLELYPDLPEWVRGIELCKVCFSTVTDR